MRAVCSLLLVLVACLGAAQTVRPMESPTSLLREVRREAKKQNLDWPQLIDGETGTYLFFTSDKDNADLTVLSTLKQDDALKKLQETALVVGLPKTDFFVRSGTDTSTVDMEFNDAMTVTKTSGSFVFPVRRLIDEIEKREFPQPIRVAFLGSLDMALLKGEAEPKTLGSGWTLMSKEDALKWETFSVKDSVASWSPIAGWVLLLGLSGFLIGLYAATIRMLIGAYKKSKVEAPVSQPLLTPEEVQAKYDETANRPWWKKAAPMAPLLIVAPVLLANVLDLDLDYYLKQAAYGLPVPIFDYVTPRSMVWVFAPMLLALPLLIILNHKNRRIKEQSGEVTPQEKIDKAVMSRIMPMMYAMAAMSFLYLIILAFPGVFSNIPRPYRLAPIFLLIGAGFLWSAVVHFKTRNIEKGEDLKEDDPIFVEAKSIGQRAGVQVKKVRLKESDSANAWATFYGTVGVTSKLKEEFNEEEIRAILAHEVGHLKGMDVPRLFWTSLVLLLTWLGLVLWIGAMDNSIGRVVRAFSFMINIFVLPVILGFLMAPARHKAELAADRFAVEVTGDLDLVARTLIKIHDINHSPHRLTAWDERMSSHPALTTRLKKLYESQGLTPPETHSAYKEPSTD